MNVNFDDTELRTLATWLRESGPKANKAALPIVRKGAVNIKDEWREAYRKSKHFRGRQNQAAAAVTFDEKVTPDVVEAEIGPNPTYRIARLAGIAHFGGANGGGGTLGDPMRFLESEAPNFEDAIADVIDEALP